MREKRLFLVLFLSSALLFLFDKKGILAGFKKGVEGRVNPFWAKIYALAKKPGRLWQGVRAKKSAFEELEEKRREIERCWVENKILKEENKDLRRLLGAPLPKNWTFLPAHVLGKKRYLLVDKGEEDGVFPGMTVVFENFLVGRVEKVRKASSLVLLPSDSESRIAVRTEGGAKGLLEGRFGTKVFLTHVLSKETLMVGERVLTSDQSYLPNLLIGKIKTKAKKTQEPFQEAEVEPFLDYQDLTTVFLVKTPEKELEKL